MIQLAWATSDITTLTDNIEINERLGKPKYDVLEYANRIERQLKSIADVLVPSLGKDYEPIRKIVETYAYFGEEHPNWLLKIDEGQSVAVGSSAGKAGRSRRHGAAMNTTQDLIQEVQISLSGMGDDLDAIGEFTALIGVLLAAPDLEDEVLGLHGLVW